MSNTDNLGGGEGSIPGTGGSFSAFKMGLDLDVGPLKKLGDAFGALDTQLEKIQTRMKNIREEADKAVKAMGGITGSSTTGAAGTKMATFNNTSPTPTPSTGGAGGGGGGGLLSQAKGVIGGGGAAIAGVAVAGAAVAKGMAAIDNRVERGRDHALSADRISVLYQQMTGMSQRQVTQQYRTPLTNYRLGSGGINTLLDLQARTGINANQQAASVEAMRTYSGFSMSTAGAANMMDNLQQAPVANRMFLMGGGGLIGPGGKQRTMQQVLQGVVSSAGLNDEKLIKSGMAAGSITRSRLDMMGVTGEMQDQVLQYAQQNLQYKKKGGKGMYDASSKASRELMGIEGNFATQAEETERERNSRDERFYSRQADNYADLEKQTQKLTKTFSDLEDKLQGVIGARTSNRIGMKIGGTLMQIGGAALMPFAPFAGAAVMAAGTAAQGDPFPEGGRTNVISNRPGRGDPMPSEGGTPTAGTSTSSGLSDDQIRVPTWGGGKKTLNQVKSMASFKGMHAKMQERVLNMMRANPNVGFGEGLRSQEAQRNLFLSRYERTDEETKIKWDGSYWKHVRGAAAAPPGMSMHGIGLAADMTGDTAWVAANAERFGLQDFANVNDEPWHVQPAELPPGFGDYVKSGAPWGRGASDTAASAESISGSTFDMALGAQDEHAGGGGAGGGSAPGPASIGYTSIASRVASGSGGTGGGAISSSLGSSSTPIASTLQGSGPGAMKGEDVARMLHAQGFRGNDLIKMVSIAQRESHFNPSVIADDSDDLSYGLFQINMMGDMGPYRRKALGLSDNKQLLDPYTNIRAAKWLFDVGVKDNNNGFYHWGDYPGSAVGTSDGGTSMATATQIVTNAKLQGDPMPETSGSSRSRDGGGSVSVRGGHTFNISVPMSVVTGTASNDLSKVAKEVARLIQREIELTNMRSS